MLMGSVKVSVEYDNQGTAWHHMQHWLSLVEVQNLGRPAEVLPAAGVAVQSLCLIRTWGIALLHVH